MVVVRAPKTFQKINKLNVGRVGINVALQGNVLSRVFMTLRRVSHFSYKQSQAAG
jgi:hypothetical protein